MNEPVDREIDGVTFRVSKLGFKDARAVGVKLAKTIGPALAVAAEKAPSLAALAEDLGGASFDAGAIKVLIDQVEDRDLDYLASMLGKVTRYSVDGGAKWPNLDEGNRENLFAGRLLLSFRWLLFACEVQFSDFLSVLAARAESAREAAPKQCALPLET